MTYRISYDDGLASIVPRREANGTRIEYFYSEQEALGRARELLDGGDHHAVTLHDDSGEVLAGIRLQLRLGASTAD
jgi:hypothetical protein